MAKLRPVWEHAAVNTARAPADPAELLRGTYRRAATMPRLTDSVAFIFPAIHTGCVLRF